MFVNAGYLSAHNAKDPSLIPGLGSGRKSRYFIHQGKNGLAFVEVLLARKIYFGEVGFLPFFRSYKFRRIGSLFLGVKFWDVTNLHHLKESRPRDSDWA
jgi:hypothetical protein